MGRRWERFNLLGCLAVAAALAVSGCDSAVVTPKTVYITPGISSRPGSVVTPTPTLVPDDTSPATAEPTATLAPTATSGPSGSPTPVPSVATVTTAVVSDSGTSPTCGAWYLSFKKPVVAGVSGAAAMNSSISTRVDGYVAAFKSSLPQGGGAGPCTLAGAFSIGINSKTLLSLSFTILEYLGGATNTTLAGSLDFGVASGAAIALTDLFTSATAGAAALSTQSRPLLKTLLGSSADTAWIDTGTAAVMANFEGAWVFRPTGLQVTFKELQVASVAEGTPTILIPWASIKAVLRADGPAGQFAS
jgi:hypothetical protein